LFQSLKQWNFIIEKNKCVAFSEKDK
jgi:hypothetical protein